MIQKMIPLLWNLYGIPVLFLSKMLKLLLLMENGLLLNFIKMSPIH